MPRFYENQRIFFGYPTYKQKMAVKQPFYGSLDFVRDNPGELVSEGTFRHLLDFLVQSKIRQADAPTIRMNCHPIQANWCPISAIPTIFMLDALPGTTLPIYPGLGQAPNMLACMELSVNCSQRALTMV